MSSPGIGNKRGLATRRSPSRSIGITTATRPFFVTLTGASGSQAKQLSYHHERLKRAIIRVFKDEGIEHFKVITEEGHGVVHALRAIPPTQKGVRDEEVVRAILRRAADESDCLDKAPARANVSGTKTAHSLDHAGRSGPANRAVAAASRGHSPVLSRNGPTTSERHRPAMVAGRTAWIHADQAKARKAIAVPLIAATVIVLREQLGKHQTHVFSFRGRPGHPSQHKGL
jgi:hypothetical protein